MNLTDVDIYYINLIISYTKDSDWNGVSPFYISNSKLKRYLSTYIGNGWIALDLYDKYYVVNEDGEAALRVLLL